jgi:acyl transferase domain-containing protein
MAGYSQDATLATQSNRIATYFGQASDDWREILNNKGIEMYYVPGVARAFGPSRLNYQYKWGGGSYAIDSACATSTTAISLACSALVARECDTALAGGGSICITPSTFAGLNKSGMISTTGGCRTYHDDADGYARGEGIGVVVLKRLEDAIADNDNVLGVVRGWARAYTSTATSITHPSAKSQSRLYEEVLRQTSVQGNDISYVEMHGTGTQAGDFEEMSSVIKVMGQGRSKDNPLTVGAVKANVGHGEAAAGVTALIKTLMVMRERKVPPQPGIPFKLNRKLPPINKLHVQIAGKNTALKPTQAKDGKFKAMVNSFDASVGPQS